MASPMNPDSFGRSAEPNMASGIVAPQSGGVGAPAFMPIPGVFVLGLGHQARQGKDTAAKILVEAYPGLVQRFAFADDLYAVARVEHGMRTKDPRLLQWLGTEVYRRRDPDVWIRCVYSKLLDAMPRVAVVTDVRFPNELAFIQALGGVCWKVERQLADGSRFVDASRSASHPSETALDGAEWDQVLVNPNDEPDVFRERVLFAFAALKTAGRVG